MAEPTRRSARLAAQKQKPLTSQVQEETIYYKNQGLVIKKQASFSLCIVSEDIKTLSHPIPTFLLQESGSPLKYEKDKEIKILAKEIISEVDLKPDGKYYKITKKQLRDINSSFEYISSDEDLSSVEVKKRKTSTVPTVGKKTKATKPTASGKYKKGVTNPNVRIIPYTDHLFDPSNEPKFGGSFRINSLNLHRAVATNNKKLLESLFTSFYKISHVLESWGPECNINCLERAILSNNELFVKKIIEEITKPTIKKGYQPPSALNLVSTGSVCIEAYGVRTRTVQMSRGGREGNNAFL